MCSLPGVMTDVVARVHFLPSVQMAYRNLLTANGFPASGSAKGLLSKSDILTVDPPYQVYVVNDISKQPCKRKNRSEEDDPRKNG